MCGDGELGKTAEGKKNATGQTGQVKLVLLGNSTYGVHDLDSLLHQMVD